MKARQLPTRQSGVYSLHPLRSSPSVVTLGERSDPVIQSPREQRVKGSEI